MFVIVIPFSCTESPLQMTMSPSGLILRRWSTLFCNNIKIGGYQITPNNSLKLTPKRRLYDGVASKELK